MNQFLVELNRVVHAAIRLGSDDGPASPVCYINASSFKGELVDADINCMMCLSQFHTAEWVSDFPNWTGRASLYKLSVPIKDYTFVIVSAASPLGEPETYIFGADEDGRCVSDWLELEGSYKGGLSHSLALANAGYRIVK